MEKKKTSINGCDISYVRLPWWLLIGEVGSRRFLTSGMCVVHKPSKTSMVFVSDREYSSDKLRYTLYHEYLEGCFMLSKFLIASDKEKMIKQLRKSLDLLKKDISDIENRFNESLKNGEELKHLFALIIELALAKKEMSAHSFSNHLTEALESRI